MPVWLSRYPRPRRIRFDNGSEFKNVFKEMCTNYGLKHKPTTTYNPRSNGIVERVHQVLGDSLRTFELQKCDLAEYDPFGSFLSTAAWAIRSTLHTTLQATPGQLVFGRDMLLDLPFKASWGAIRACKQDLINKGVLIANRTRYAHTYKVNDKYNVCVRTSYRTEGPVIAEYDLASLPDRAGSTQTPPQQSASNN